MDEQLAPETISPLASIAPGSEATLIGLSLREVAATCRQNIISQHGEKFLATSLMRLKNYISDLAQHIEADELSAFSIALRMSPHPLTQPLGIIWLSQKEDYSELPFSSFLRWLVTGEPMK
jgi:hypothetical protein